MFPRTTRYDIISEAFMVVVIHVLTINVTMCVGLRLSMGKNKIG